MKAKHRREFPRLVDLIGHGSYAARLERLVAGRRFIEENGYGPARRERVTGDASSRSYERLTLGKRDIILMNSPKRPDGPPVKDGKPYSEIAHLAEDIAPFIAIANGLRGRGFSAPEIYAADIKEGFIALEDLGDNKVVSGDPPAPIRQCYEAAVYVLIALHKQILPDLLPVAPHVNYRLPTYDMDAFMIEVELLLDWYLPFQHVLLAPSAREEFLSLWRELVDAGGRRAGNLGAARFSFAESAVAAGPPRHRVSRPARFPGRRARSRGLRSRLTAAGRPRRYPGAMGVRSVAQLRARARRSTIRNSNRWRSRNYTPPWRRSAPPKSSVFSRGSIAATASRSIFAICRAYGNISSARLSIPIWRGLEAWYKIHVPPPEASSK